MASPFPGMDLYLESQAFWPDFHVRFVNYWSEALSDLLPDNYEVRMDERINLVELPAEKVQRIEPDLAVTRRGPSPASPAPSGVTTLEPVTIPLLIAEERREPYIEILHRPERTLVAVVELLSPANKEEPSRGLYLAKRGALLRQNVHLVELDLLLGGQRLPMQRELPPGHYYAFIARRDRRPDCQVYAWTLRQPLPPIPIPLLPPDPDAWVDLAAVFRTTYERGRYARSLDYQAPPPVSLPADTRAWLQERVRSS